MARRKLIAGNWKMNGLTGPATALARDVAAGAGGFACELLVCPPAVLLGLVAKTLEGSAVALGGQDCHTEAKGAHTGDVSAEMLHDVGCRYVIVGHSERRANHTETDDMVRAKAIAAKRAGLTAIVCVGETEAERDAGRAIDVVRTQVAGSLPEGWSAGDIVIAYEPVWAIGTGRTPTVQDVADIHAAIRGMLGRQGPSTRILYGGSMKPDNAAALLAVPDVDGGLIGGASLQAADFLAIAKAAG